MHVKLISWTHDREGRSLLEQVAYAARVSNPANQNNNDTAEKLVRYLIKNQHWSPLEMVNICMEIETTRDIARQILRHRSFSFQEFSQRYAVADLGFEKKETRMQDLKNRQNSIETDDHLLQNEWFRAQERVIYAAKREYDWAIKNGIAKEQARAVLPEGMTVSRLYMNGTLRSWVHYIQLRTTRGTQEEHRIVAALCGHAIEEIFPMMAEFIEEK
jgi:thymidylate synthase (FAD)